MFDVTSYGQAIPVRASAAAAGTNYTVVPGDSLPFRAVVVRNRGTGKVYFALGSPSATTDGGGSFELLSGEEIEIPVPGKNVQFQADAISTKIQVIFYR